ncbi:unnamed protein product [Kluyveromyces dobzhanskii CBS 2104]|uniref:WGS project CCBQ000000000 data, contig 00058 n=1 Tax=Kluyveromyces dobzhanskii CBS 2104 TaxID=1427455 RepID=A0A0A8LDT2_9SACH|nr:unnamed protein product [Kluyveromyces dobzhanskii CBS 2104]
MEGSGDNFEYLLQLVKTLGSQAWATRQQTDKVEQSLKRLAKQNQIKFSEYTKPPSDVTVKQAAQFRTKTKEEELVEENYRLMYQIEQQEYIHSKVCMLIQQIDEMIVSMRNFIVEYKTSAPEKNREFISRSITAQVSALTSGEKQLSGGHTTAQNKLRILTEELVDLFQNVPWHKVANDNLNYVRLKNLIADFEDKYCIQILP